VLRSLRAALLAAALIAAPARADQPTLAAVQAGFSAADIGAAIASAEARLALAPDDAQARFGLGVGQFLHAVEGLGQALHRHGLQGASGASFGGLLDLPFLRLPVPPNAAPQPLTYEGFRAILAQFVDDLAIAEVTLAQMPTGAVDLPLNLANIRLDLDGDGIGSENEALWRIFSAVAGAGWLEDTPEADLPADFDAADAPWLRAYCHLLSALAEVLLAHDWHEAFDATFHGVFPGAGLPSARLNELPYATLEALASGKPLAEDSDPQALIMYATAADAIAFLHLWHWQVGEPQRLTSALAHLEGIPPLSRQSFDLAFAETDSRNEWIPNPNQTGVLGTQVTAEQVEGWRLFLDEFAALLKGEKLLPHWRFNEGINIRRMFLEPRAFDLVLLIQGSAALPYLESGALTDGEAWQRMIQLLGGDFFRYAIWFN
jgi:hypothetical protein